ncbi:hypothetical protein PT2222_100301 [Paraburkholderia tropica]
MPLVKLRKMARRLTHREAVVVLQGEGGKRLRRRRTVGSVRTHRLDGLAGRHNCRARHQFMTAAATIAAQRAMKRL